MDTEEYYGGTYPEPPEPKETDDEYIEGEDFLRDVLEELKREEVKK